MCHQNATDDPDKALQVLPKSHILLKALKPCLEYNIKECSLCKTWDSWQGLCLCQVFLRTVEGH